MDGLGLVQTFGAIAGLLTIVAGILTTAVTFAGKRNTDRAAELRMLLDERKADTVDARGDVERLERERDALRDRLDVLREQHRQVADDLWFAQRRVTAYAHQLVDAGLTPDRMPDLREQL